MSYPNFLIIGAMKAGTTTLFRDLVSHPQIFLPEQKEPETLLRFGSNLDAIRRDYRSLFSPAKAGQLKGEASTAYTKRPDFECPAQVARELCGPDLKLIYLERDPIKRIISQYKHEYGLGIVKTPLNEAVLRLERYVAYSLYDWQLEPWLEAFDPENLLTLSFEDYIANRAGTVKAVCTFLGVDPALLPPPNEDRAFNASENKPTAARGIWKVLINSRIYQRQVKPRIPWALRDRVASLVLPKESAISEPLAPEARRVLLDALESRCIS